MINVTRIVVAVSALSSLAVIACSSGPTDETVSVQVEQGTVDPNCIKGGITCGVGGGGVTSSSGLASSSGLVMDPGTSSGGGTSGSTPPPLQPPGGVTPLSCDPCVPAVNDKGAQGCACHGGGNGLQSLISCPSYAPCRYGTRGVYRCYQVDWNTGECH